MVVHRCDSIEDVAGGFWVLGQPGLCGKEWNKREKKEIKEGKGDGGMDGGREGRGTVPQMIEQNSLTVSYICKISKAGRESETATWCLEERTYLSCLKDSVTAIHQEEKAHALHHPRPIDLSSLHLPQ